MNGEKFAVHLQLDNRISARQVRSRPYERHREKRHDVQTATLLPFVRAAVYACLRRAIHFVRKGAKAGSFAFDYGAGDNDTPVARHNRPGGRPWVVISKTPGEPVSGCKRTSSPVVFPCVRGASCKYGTKIKSDDENDAVVDVRSMRRRAECSAPHPFAVNGG